MRLGPIAGGSIQINNQCREEVLARMGYAAIINSSKFSIRKCVVYMLVFVFAVKCDNNGTMKFSFANFFILIELYFEYNKFRIRISFSLRVRLVSCYRRVIL